MCRRGSRHWCRPLPVPLAPAPLPLPETWGKHQAVRFLEAFDPLIQQARSRLTTRLHGLLHGQSETPCDTTTLEALLYENLPAQLLQIVMRTMVLELNVARVQELLPGTPPKSAFRVLSTASRSRHIV